MTSASSGRRRRTCGRSTIDHLGVVRGAGDPRVVARVVVVVGDEQPTVAQLDDRLEGLTIGKANGSPMP